MRIITKSGEAKLESEIRNAVSKEIRKTHIRNISQDIPERANVTDKLVQDAMERVSKSISQWRTAVESAEDLDNPDREELIQMYKDFIDDYQLFATMQARTTKAVSGAFIIYDEKGDKDEEEMAKFIDPKGFPLPWFRKFMTIVEEAKFYGWEAIQLGDVIDDRFNGVEKIPEQNLVPCKDAMIKDHSMSYQEGSENVIYFEEDPQDTWIVRVGSKIDLGLINKCAPYIVWKGVFGNWSQHASIFGMPMRVGTTDLADTERKQNLINAFESVTGGAQWMIKDPLDEIELIERSGSADPHNIYGMLIEKCDQAISKIILSQTGTTDEKAFSGSANVHENTEDGVIFSDKLDIAAVVNEQLIPRMKKIGMISDSKKIFGSWDFSEKMTIEQWSKVFLTLSQAGFSAPASEVTRVTGIEIDETVVAVPENKTFSVMNMYDKYLNKK